MQKRERRKRRRDGAKEAYWRGQVERQAQSGLGVRAFCRQQGLAENLFYAWRRELAVRDREQAAAAADVQRTSAAQKSAAPDTAFTEVLVTAPAESKSTTPTATLEIILASPRRIAIAPGFDPATLTAVLDVLEQRPC
jgi:transposase-like protein